MRFNLWNLFIGNGQGEEKGLSAKKKKSSSSSKGAKVTTTGKTYPRKTVASRKHPSDSQPLTAEEARQLQMEWMKR